MKAKLKVIKNWEFEEFELTGTSFKYSPTGCKGMVARSEDEIVFWTYHLAQKCSGVLWVKGEVSRWIPSPEPKEQQDVWEDPVLLSCDRGILLVCPASKSLCWMPQMDGEWIPIPMDNWCAQGIPKPVAVTGSQGVFPIVCRVDNSADATNSFTSLTVDFETMTAHWAESGSCVYSKAGTRQTHLAAVERAGGNFAQADFHYNYPMIGSILEQNGQFYAFLESSTINPAGLSLMGYYWYLELEENGLFKKKLWGKDNLSRLPGKHGMRGKFSGDRTCLILSPIFKNDDWKGIQGMDKANQEELADIFAEIEYEGTAEEFLRQGMTPVRQMTIGPMFVGRKLEEIGWESVPMNDPRITAHPEWLENLQRWAGQDSQSFEIHETVRFERNADSWRAWLCHPMTYPEFQRSLLWELAASLPTPDEWAYLCGGGCRTLFPWGDGLDYKMKLHHFEREEEQGKSYDIEQANFFGLSIAYDPYKRELVDGKTLTTCGGDGGCNICGGMGPLLGYLPCSPHCKPEVREDNEIHNDYDFFRPVIRVQTSGWRMVIDRAQE